jgi:hypothetical protein
MREVFQTVCKTHGECSELHQRFKKCGQDAEVLVESKGDLAAANPSPPLPSALPSMPTTDV